MSRPQERASHTNWSDGTGDQFPRESRAVTLVEICPLRKTRPSSTNGSCHFLPSNDANITGRFTDRIYLDNPRRVAAGRCQAIICALVS
jgi:hypothetical protein